MRFARLSGGPLDAEIHVGANDETSEHLRLVLQIVEAVRQWPAEVVEHEYLWETFGSWYITIRRHGKRFRLSFDGRDRLLTVEQIAAHSGDEFAEPRRHVTDVPFPQGLSASSVGELLALAGRSTS